MKTTFLILLLTSIGLLAQTPAAPEDAGATTDPAVLRQALRDVMAGKTNAPAVWPAALATPDITTPAPAATQPSPVPAATEGETTTVPPTQGQLPGATAPAASTDVGTPPAGAPEVPAETPTVPVPGRTSSRRTAAVSAPPEEVIPAGQINFAAAELNQVLTLYADLVNRTMLRSPNLASPPIVLKTQTALTKSEAIQALDAVLALNGIAMINIGEKFIKVVPIAQAEQEGQAISKLSPDELPDLGQYVTHVVQLKTAKPSELVPILQAFGKTKSILPVDSSQILVIRDYTENVKRMLEVIAQIDVTVPSEFISEVIPIKYALAADIASALNSLSGSGSAGTSVGGSTTRTGGLGGTGARTGTTTGNRTGIGQQGQAGQLGGAQAGAGNPSSGSSFSDRLQNIIRRASTSGSGDVQVLGQTKIIADERTNSLLIFAMRQDMAMIKDIISKLDVVLAQVLIESIIMEVTLNKSRDLGISYIQHPKDFGSFSGVGAVRNTTILSPGVFQNALSNATTVIPSGFSYFARVGDDLDVTMTAIAGDGRVNVLSRPRIQTSHAVPANLFIGNTVPYITGTTYGDFSGASSRSAYTEKQVGITLDVLPLINPDGLVVMDIQEDIEQLGPTTTIDGNAVPTTTKRSASAKVAVRNGDTIILGGFIATTKNSSKSGVPFLKDLPLLGYLFRSSNESGERAELIVLLKPTVLPTPEIAASVAKSEKRLMPGVRRAEAEITEAEQKAILKEDKKHIDE